MDWLYALLALGAVALPLALAGWLIERRQRRDARARIARCSRKP